MLEEYLSGQEGTVTVMPPSQTRSRYWSMPIILCFNHTDGIAPYNGVVAVTANSIIAADHGKKQVCFDICKACMRVVENLKVTGPIRIYVRQFTEDERSRFAISDVNMKPNMTGPGRPGRGSSQSDCSGGCCDGLGLSEVSEGDFGVCSAARITA